MIKTLTLNPALDKTIIVKDFKLNNVNRIKEVFKDAGGKGINVSKMLHNLDEKTKAAGFLGGYAGQFIRSELDKMGLNHNFVEIDDETRTNIKMVDKKQNTFTDLNEQGGRITSDNINELKQNIFADLKADDILTLSGSIPPGVNNNIYGELIETAKRKNIKTILDAEGELFKKGVESGPTIIKPNDHELSLYFKQVFTNLNEMIKAAQNFFEFDIEMVMLSLGKKGAIFLNKENTIKIEPLKIDVKSTVGAGDAMVAGLALGLVQNLPVEEMIKLAAAASSASLINNGTQMGKQEEVEHFKQEIELKYL